jgi:glutamyl-Q tRNA(Asp) synthetase
VIAHDRLQGELAQDVEHAVGDFVLRRRDGYFAYQLAVVVDDAAQSITDVVRGFDLRDQTPRQIVLQRLLGCPTPRYLHLPLLVEPDGAKLSKSARAVPAARERAPATLSRVLALLRHAPPAELCAAPVREQLAWAVAAWDAGRCAGVRAIALPPPAA